MQGRQPGIDEPFRAQAAAGLGSRAGNSRDGLRPSLSAPFPVRDGQPVPRRPSPRPGGNPALPAGNRPRLGSARSVGFTASGAQPDRRLTRAVFRFGAGQSAGGPPVHGRGDGASSSREPNRCLYWASNVRASSFSARALARASFFSSAVGYQSVDCGRQSRISGKVSPRSVRCMSPTTHRVPNTALGQYRPRSLMGV